MMLCCVYVYEEWLPSALCGAARGYICDMYTQTHMSQQQTIAVTATVRLRALSGPGTKRKEMMPTIRATAEPTATGRNIILGERVWKIDRSDVGFNLRPPSSLRKMPWRLLLSLLAFPI